MPLLLRFTYRSLLGVAATAPVVLRSGGRHTLARWPVPVSCYAYTMLRRLFVLWPAAIVDAAWFAYKVLLLVVSLLALGCAALAYLSYVLIGVRLFW